MPKRSSKTPKGKPSRPRKQVHDADPNVAAFRAVQHIAAMTEGVNTLLSNDEQRRAIMREMGRRGGLKGGKTRVENMTSAQRTASAKKAAKIRWAKVQAEKH